MPYYDNSKQMSMSMPSAQQPIYANFNAVVNVMQPQPSLPNIQMSGANHIQTKAEVHAEKIPFSNSNESKVSPNHNAHLCREQQNWTKNNSFHFSTLF